MLAKRKRDGSDEEKEETRPRCRSDSTDSGIPRYHFSSLLPDNGSAPDYIPPYLPPLTIQLPPTWTFWQPEVVRYPPVVWRPQYRLHNNYGRSGTEVKLMDTRSCNDIFPVSFPLEEYTHWDVAHIPDEILADIVMNPHRSPIVSFRFDTRTTISRISPTMVAKWGPNVKSVEPDMMYYVQSMAEMEKAVPLVYRSLTDRRTKFYIIVMEYIDGHNILDLWDSYTVELKAEASEKAAKLVEKMQSETSPRPYPGPIGIARIKTLVHKDFPMPLCIGRERYEDYINGLISRLNEHRPRA